MVMALLYCNGGRYRGAYMRDPEEEIFFAKKIIFQTIQMERNGKTITMTSGQLG